MLAVRPLDDFKLELEFDDDSWGIAELRETIARAEVFAPLRDPALFAQVTVDSDIHTIAWPNGADFAPEFLRQLVRHHAAA